MIRAYCLTCLIGFVVLGSARADLIPALELSANPNVSGSIWASSTRGWEFHLTEQLSVTALGYFDAGGDGFFETHTVGLWTATGSTTPLASVDVLSSDPLLGHFRYHLLPTPLLLSPGVQYVVAGTTVSGNDLIVVNDSNFTTDSRVSWDASRSVVGNTTLTFPTNTSAIAGQWGATFASDPVPEPGGLALLAALAGGAAGWRFLQRARCGHGALRFSLSCRNGSKA
jgi:hypothetical protein